MECSRRMQVKCTCLGMGRQHAVKVVLLPAWCFTENTHQTHSPKSALWRIRCPTVSRIIIVKHTSKYDKLRYVRAWRQNKCVCTGHFLVSVLRKLLQMIAKCLRHVVFKGVPTRTCYQLCSQHVMVVSSFHKKLHRNYVNIN